MEATMTNASKINVHELVCANVARESRLLTDEKAVSIAMRLASLPRMKPSSTLPANMSVAKSTPTPSKACSRFSSVA